MSEVYNVTSDTLHEDQIKLANGCHPGIRSLRRGEEAVVRELYARLSPRTRCLRFFSEMPVLPDSLVRTLADVDDVARVALVVEMDCASGSDVVALGNVAMNDDRAEVGIVVADAWQRKGIGTALATELMKAAELRGHHRFRAHCLYDNYAMRRLLDRVADVASTSTQSGVLEISFVRRRSAAVLRPAFVDATRRGEAVYKDSRDPKQAVSDLMEQAYERILARGRETARR